MRIIQLVYIAFLIFQLIGCGGQAMIATVVDRDSGEGIPNVSIEVKNNLGKVVAKQQTNGNGVFSVDGLDKHGTYKVSFSKDTIIPDEKEYTLDRIPKNEIKALKIQLGQVAGIKGRIMGAVKPEPTETNPESDKSENNAQDKKDIQTVPVPGAAVYLIVRWLNTERTMEPFTASTNPDGFFEIPRITKDGEYRLTIFERNYIEKSCPLVGFRKLKPGEIWDVGEIVLDPVILVDPGDIDTSQNPKGDTSGKRAIQDSKGSSTKRQGNSTGTDTSNPPN